MFDIFLIYDFRAEGVEKHCIQTFSKNPSYKDIIYHEIHLQLTNGYASWLERNESDNSYTINENLHFLIYGSVFSNSRYKQLKSILPHRLTPQEISILYNKYEDEFVKYLKGSFVIVLIDEKNGKVKCITDRLNVLPLYYSFKNQILILSSNVKMIKETGLISDELDYLALTEQLLFDYMLRDHYLYKDIRVTENARIYSFCVSSISNNIYWSVEELYNEKLMPRKGSLDLLSTQLFETVNLYSSDREKVLVSFTGGFDGRTNVAMLQKSQSDYLCFSYGMPGSKQISIPEEISKKLNINYKPIYLDKKFEQNYSDCAGEAIEFSNGTAPIMRANYPFAYKKLRNFSDLIITGLFGSEILRPLHNLGIQINDRSESIFLNVDYPGEIIKAIDQVNKKGYLMKKILDDSKKSLVDEFKNDYFEKYKSYDKITRFFFFIIQEGIRKYFMQEIQIERVYVTTRFPYLDDDLIELIYKTTYAGMYNGFLGKSKLKRRKGQLLYAHIIRKYSPELGKYKLDRGYTSDDLLKPFPLNFIHLAYGVYTAKKYYRQHGNDTFDSEKWTKETILRSLKSNYNNSIFEKGIIDSFNNGSYLNDLLTYTHFISILNFLHSNSNS